MVDTERFHRLVLPYELSTVSARREIILATLQHKPVLFVSPPVEFPSLHQLRDHLKADARARAARTVEMEIPHQGKPEGHRVSGT